MKQKQCGCVCHKLGYIYCGPEWCANDHPAWHANTQEERGRQ